MKKSWMRLLSLICALLIVIGQLPMLAWAEPDPANEQTQTQEDAAKPEEEAAVAGEKQDETPADPPADEQPQPDQNAAAVQPASGTDLTPATETQAPVSEIQTPATETQAPPPAVNPAPAQTENQENNPPVEVNNAPENPAPTEPENPTPAEPIKPAADHEMRIGDEAVFALQPGQAYTIRVPGKEGKMQVDAEAEFALRIEVKDEKSEKTKVETSNADGTFQMIYGGRSERTFLLTVTAANGQSAGNVKVSVIKYVETPKEETVVEPVNDSVNEEKNDNNEEVKEEEKKEEEDKPEETEKPEDKVEEEKTEGIDQKEETKEDTKEKENTTGEKTAEGAEKPQEQPEEEKITEFACDLPGAQDISLAETITGLGITGEDEVASFMENIESVTVTDPEVVSLTQTEEDWSFRILKDSAMQESLTISMTDETVYTIATNGEGETETTSEDKTVVVSTENDFYLPEEANAYAETLTDAEHEAAVAAVQEQEADTGDVSGYQVFDIGLENVNPEQYEGFQVEVKLEEEIGGKEFKLYQVQDGTATDITDTLELKSTENEDGTQSVTSFSFSTEEFAQYVLCYTLEAFYQTQSGETYKITVNCDPEAGVPAGSTLSVREILPEEEAYQQYLNESAEKLGVSSENVKFARFFDIEIVDKNGEKIEPAKPAQVTIAYHDALELEGEAKLNVVHFAEKGTEVIEDVQISEDKTELLYEQGSFSVTGTIVTEPQANKVYAMIIKHTDGEYYVVENDGMLTHIEAENLNYNTTNGTVESVDLINPIFWTYTSLSGGQFSLWHNKDAREYSGFVGLPLNYTRRYINVDVDNGLKEIDDNKTEEIAQQIIQLANNHLKHGDNYLGVTTNEEGKLCICGKTESGSATTVYLVEAQNVKYTVYADRNEMSKELIRNHMVNHIDISVSGKATIKVPLAYGTYDIQEVDENGNLIDGTYQVGGRTFDSSNNKLTVQQSVAIDEKDLRKADITTYTKNGDVKNAIKDAYIVTGYSKNKQGQGQIRLEGRFKVADVKPVPSGVTDPNDYTYPDGNEPESGKTVRDLRKEKRIYYDLSVTKPVTFLITYTDPSTSKKYAIMHGKNKPFTITTEVALGTSFDFWDTDNECPGVKAIFSQDVWQTGVIPDNSEWTDTWYDEGYNKDSEDAAAHKHTGGDGGPGMDFTLKVLTNEDNPDPNVMAIEVTKYIQGDNGTSIKLLSLQNSTNTKINIYQGNKDTQSFSHDKKLNVGTDGVGMFYDYDVTGGTYTDPAYVKISEVANSIEEVLVDASGKRWIYDRTQMETEYVWRDYETRSNHIIDGYNKDTQGGLFDSTPEIIGQYLANVEFEHKDEHGNVTEKSKNAFNGFLEFYIYNIYKPAGYLKIHKAVTANGDAPVSDGEKAALTGTYTFTVYTDENCSKTYNHDVVSSEGKTTREPITLTVTIAEDGEAQYSDAVMLPIGKYWIKETFDPDGDVKPVSEIVAVEVKDTTTTDEPAVAEFTNNIETGSLAVTKKVTGSYHAKADETYTITVKRGDQYVKAQLSGDKLTATYQELVDETTTTTIPTYEIQDGKTFTITNMPVGDYTVTETPVSIYGCEITTKYKVDDKTVITATATVKKDITPNVEIENNYPDAELTIAKEIKGLTDAQAINEAAGRITITVIDNQNNILLDGVPLTASPFKPSEDGKTYTAVLKSTDNSAWAEYLVIDGLYTVIETAAEPDRYIIKEKQYEVYGRETSTSLTDAVSGTGYPVDLFKNAEAYKFNGQIRYENTYADRAYPHKIETSPGVGVGELCAVEEGGLITYEIRYKNKTDVVQKKVEIEDILDENLIYVSSEPAYSSNKENAYYWVLNDVSPKGTEERVITLTVQVREGAKKAGKVENNAGLKVNNDHFIYNEENKVINPITDKPTKKEIDPYQGTGELGLVGVGQVITYEISYKNYKSSPATIKIKDVLDPNVEYVEDDELNPKGSYHKDGHYVTWAIPNVDSGASGKVQMKVRVLKSALDTDDLLGKVVNVGDTATVKVGDDSEFKLDTVENLIPIKKEIQPFEGIGTLGQVGINDMITYQISYKNYKNEPAAITIKDTLDTHVKFESATDGGKLDGNTVTWKLTNVPAKKEGTVTVTVSVLKTASTSNGGPGKVINNGDTATVQVNDDPEIKLNSVENPVPAYPYKREVAPYTGKGVLGFVRVDDEITYEIVFKNDDTSAEKSDIVITDILDDNVSYVKQEATSKAKYEFNISGKTATWTFKDVAYNDEGVIKLTVKVLENARTMNRGPAKVVNKGATVKIGNNVKELDTVENPLLEKTERGVNNGKKQGPYKGSGELGPVDVDDEITYYIEFYNYKDKNVTVTDKLDPNVEFVSAPITVSGGKDLNPAGTYDKKTHTVTWLITDCKAGVYYQLPLTVKVKAGAKEAGKVSNTAQVKVGNDPAVDTDTVTNPVPEKPTKKEVSPYVGNGTLGAVGEGDEITYEISYKNYKSTAATVTIKDKLDRHVAFVSAGDGKYDKDKRTVTWTLKDVKPGEEGTVTLTVRVLSTALESNDGPGKVVNNADGRSATVQVGNDPEFMLETVENPVVARPSKRETAPYTGSGELGAVGVDDEITYEITYTNYMTSKATVTIKDQLDKNVTFISANNSGKYNKDTGIVTWTIKDVEAKKTGTVKLTVKVKDSALKSKKGPGEVVNNGETATVQVGNDKEFTLNSVVNPVPEAPVKREKLINRTKSEGTGTLATVKVGDTITYDIEYKNYQTDAATIVITDELDENVEYVQPSKTDKTVKYDKKTHTVTWTITNVKAGGSGKVTLMVRVLEGAKKATKVINTAGVKVGSDLRLYTNSVTNPVSNKNPSPNTGDDSHNGLWLTLLIISLLGCGWFGVKAFRGKGNKKPGAER